MAAEARNTSVEERIVDLCSGMKRYVTEFDKRHIFTGPSLYFHRRTIERLRRHAAPSLAIINSEFLESLYATLASWGMHRMGPTGAKLRDFESFSAAFLRHRDGIRELENEKLVDIADPEIEDVIARLWTIVSGLRLSASETQIVAGSKALHHVLPDLVPPIDREYTLRFFYGYKPPYPGPTEFRTIVSQFRAIARRCGNQLEQFVKLDTGAEGMNTSATKVIDNAIVGYALFHPKSVQLGGR